MKKNICVILGVFIVLAMAGCNSNSDERNSGNSEQANKEDEHFNKSQIVFVEDDSATWSRDLWATGMLVTDLNKDGVDDTIHIENTEIEGSQYISKFEVKLSNTESGFLISETYDASFEKMKMVDIDQDTNEELILLFDSHGAGGQGTHDLYVLWLKEDGVVARMIDTIDATTVHIEPDWNVDSIYDIDKIEYNGDKKLLVRQYMWGGDEHSNWVGDLVSIVSFDSESGLFKAEEAWIEQ